MARAAANAIFVGEQETPVALWGRRSASTALATVEDLKLSLDLSPALPDARPEDDSLRQFVSSQVLSAYAAADEFQRQQSGNQAAAESSYPGTPLATHLKLVSQLLKSGAQARVYYTIQGGYDTHSVQLYSHSRLLQEFSGAVKAFLDDLKAAGLDDRVLVLAFSEFGAGSRKTIRKGPTTAPPGQFSWPAAPSKAGSWAPLPIWRISTAATCGCRSISARFTPRFWTIGWPSMRKIFWASRSTSPRSSHCRPAVATPRQPNLLVPSHGIKLSG